jgi:hypothetical protein
MGDWPRPPIGTGDQDIRGSSHGGCCEKLTVVSKPTSREALVERLLVSVCAPQLDLISRESDDAAALQRAATLSGRPSGSGIGGAGRRSGQRQGRWPVAVLPHTNQSK